MTRLLPPRPALSRWRRRVGALPHGLPTALTFTVSVGALILGSSLVVGAGLPRAGSPGPGSRDLALETRASARTSRLVPSTDSARLAPSPSPASSGTPAAAAARTTLQPGSAPAGAPHRASATATAGGSTLASTSVLGAPASGQAGREGDGHDGSWSGDGPTPSPTPDSSRLAREPSPTPSPTHHRWQASPTTSPEPTPTADPTSEPAPTGEPAPTPTPEPTPTPDHD